MHNIYPYISVYIHMHNIYTDSKQKRNILRIKQKNSNCNYIKKNLPSTSPFKCFAHVRVYVVMFVCMLV